MLSVGIDPGQKGGIAALNDRKELVYYIDMPFDKETGLIGFSWINEVMKIERFRPGSGINVWIERNHGMPGNNWASMFKFGYATGQIVGMVRTRGIPIYFVPALRWKDSILTKAARGKGKQYAMDYVKRTYGIDTKHDGISDAICIAEYGWNVDNH